MYNNQLFNPQQLMQNCMQGIMGGARGNGGRAEYVDDFNCFFTDIENGELACPPAFARVISRLIKAGIDECRKNGTAADGRHGERHKRFKAALEELRNAPLAERAALMEKHFAGLDGNERLVLMELSNDRPLRKKAANNGMSEEAFVAARHSIEQKMID